MRFLDLNKFEICIQLVDKPFTSTLSLSDWLVTYKIHCMNPNCLMRDETVSPLTVYLKGKDYDPT